ncbi:hypothetical protein [Deinococcus maricopensis]|uniref:Uncharacterized protein n=1 Tax=Deinococcus maricopensis (strain DSM 21211 / LMG 22137 / NRRL B-23946 / LB-34) TaxID=709986 RepID=E8U7H2_DEIML|nr:hypothetical protein [Deinococcus maricopensis]ADV67011.1 hypothetical protein Deima_1361 [Deinococcus maricopensis DSM 21211]
MTEHERNDRAAQESPEGNAERDLENGRIGIPVDEGAPAEIVEDAMLVDDLFREENREDAKNPNDAPAFDDGRLGGSEGEERSDYADPSAGDAGGEIHGGIGRRRSGGFDGGPDRD